MISLEADQAPSEVDMTARYDRPPPVSNRIPIELYALFFQHVHHAPTLSNLCTVSRVFQQEAERILYHTVRLPCDYDRVFSWFKAVLQNSRLANLVYSLTLPRSLRPEGIRSESTSRAHLEKLVITIKWALSSLTKLCEIYTYDSSGLNYLRPSMFRGHRFQLQVFESHLPLRYTLMHWRKFLLEQPTIRHWAPDLDPSIDHVLEAYLLPSLISARVRLSMLQLLHSRPIRALQITKCFSMMHLDDLSVGLGPFRHTLRRLSLDIGDLTESAIGAPQVVRIINAVVPNLHFLDFRAKIGLLHHTLKDQATDFLSALSNLAHLSSLVLKLSPYSPTHPRLRDYDAVVAWNLRHPKRIPPEWVDSRPENEEQASELARALMKANTSLRHVAFEVKGTWAGGKLPCYSKMWSGSDSQGDGVVAFEGFDILVSDSWRDF